MGMFDEDDDGEYVIVEDEETAEEIQEQPLITTRGFLKAAGTVGVLGSGAALAGRELRERHRDNNNQDDQNPPPAEPSPTQSSTQSATPEPADPSLQVLKNQEINIGWNQILDELEQIPSKHKVSLGIKKGDYQLNNAKLVVEKPREDKEPLQNEFSVQQNAVRLEEPQLFNGQQKAYLEYQTQDGIQTTEPVTLTKNIPQGFRLDLENPEEEQLNDWSTVYGFDDHIFDAEEFLEQRIQWMKSAPQRSFYPKVLKNPYNSSFGYDYSDLSPEWAEKEAENSEEFQDILRQGQGKVLDRNQEINPRGPSAGFAAIANTTELLFRQEREEDLTGAGVNTYGGHGLTIYHHPEWGWNIADTTGGSVTKPEKWQGNENWWIPWSDYNVDVNKDPDPNYQNKKDLARQGLTSLATEGYGDNHQWFGTFFINDDWLKDAYDQIRDDGDIEPIIKPIQQALDKQRKENRETEKHMYAGVYGDSLKDSHVIYGEDLSDIHQITMEQEASLTTQEIETMLEEKAA